VQVQFTITSGSGRPLEVLISTSVVTWPHLGCVTNATSTLSFTDTAATGDRKFCRLRLP
jgi:hypothetical protein